MYNDELSHWGVKGMKWGVRRNRSSGGNGSSKSKKTSYFDKKREMKKEYRKDKGPRRGLVNAANSAARSYYRAERTNSFKEYRKAKAKMDLKIARLTPEQVANGRYRVARARSIKRKTISGLLAGGAGVALCASGGAFLGVPVAVVGGVVLNSATGGRYYAKQKRAYGGARAKYAIKTQEKKEKEDSKA